jgi:hypothetical protein
MLAVFDDVGRVTVFVLFVAVDLNSSMVVSPEEVVPCQDTNQRAT